jgi:putative DNA methylase
LHLWWAWRPLASSRAVMLALLWPDPSDPLCPPAFKGEARKRLREVPNCNPGMTDKDLRQALLAFIGDFANWDNATQRAYQDVSRALVKAAHAPDDGSPYEPPLVVDPFAGGGSIPLEALRVGCEAVASDINAVACLILKAKLRDIPRHGPELADELRCVGAEIKREAEKELAELYPKDPDGATPIAYLWARTVRCESPNCGAEIPLVRSFWLCKKAGRRRALRYLVGRPKGGPPQVAFEVFEPKSEKDVPGGTVTRAKATCVCCRAVLPPERVRAQLVTQRGGADVVFDGKGRRIGGARMLAVVTLRPGESGRHYRLSTERDYEPVRKSQARVAKLQEDWEHGGKQGLCPVPDEPLPPIGTLGFRVQRYGMLQWGDLFTARQLSTLEALARLAKSAGSEVVRDLLALSLSKLAERNNSICDWMVDVECPGHLYTQQVVPPAWDFAEGAPLGESSGSFSLVVDNTANNADACVVTRSMVGAVDQVDAADLVLPDQSVDVYFTDPPYYDAVPYSDLSDFFYVWLRRVVPDQPLLCDHFDRTNALTQKNREIVQDEARAFDGSPKSSVFFERRIGDAFREGRRVIKPDGIGCVVFAHKTTEGWEALISGMMAGGWVISGSWSIATERPARMRARQSAALESSVHLVCRPRREDAGVGDWAEVLRELPKRVADWMDRLQHEGVRGADLVFACIGPALEIFSRYTKVETAEGREVKLDEYLAKVWEVVGRSALAQVLGTAEARARNGAAGAVEEDARLTALFLWTLQATDGEGAEDAVGEEEDEDAADDDEDEGGSGRSPKGFTLVFDVVRRFAQPLGIDLPKWEGRVIETKKGVVRLLPVAERAKQLFGEDGASAVASRLEQTTAPGTNPLQGMLFPEMEAAPPVRGARGRGRRVAVDVSDESLAAAREATTLDRVHAAMLLQAGGRTNALRALLKAEQERGPDFLRLANALSALYPKGSEEKRLVDAMLLAVPR